MKIDVNDTCVSCSFDSIAIGETFKGCNAYWMKTECIDDVYDPGGTPFNAVNLSNGKMVKCDEDDSVIPIKLKVVFDNEEV